LFSNSIIQKKILQEKTLSTTVVQNRQAPSRLKLFFALSRTHHVLLDVATPVLCAVLWLGAFPPSDIMILGFVTAFAGYTAIYALNDVVDFRVDREKLKHISHDESPSDIDAVYIRHPLAQGALSLPEGLFWTVSWALLAFIGAYLLNPICPLIFLLAGLLEAGYCLLLKVTHLRTIVSGVVKTLGGIAAVFAVDPRPDPVFVMVLFLWLFFWEIGGQNVPNDWVDMEEDRKLRAKTVPIMFGVNGAGIVIVCSLIVAVFLSGGIVFVLPTKPDLFYICGVLLSGMLLLLLPAYRLLKTKDPRQSSRLFNSASYYPLAVLCIVLFCVIT
jgi:4-hydroxybenzoate polyprenyltransferase